jgi:hypothetical protein
MNRSKQTGMGKKTIVILLISLAPSHKLAAIFDSEAQSQVAARKNNWL